MEKALSPLQKMDLLFFDPTKPELFRPTSNAKIRKRHFSKCHKHINFHMSRSDYDLFEQMAALTHSDLTPALRAFVKLGIYALLKNKVPDKDQIKIIFTEEHKRRNRYKAV